MKKISEKTKIKEKRGLGKGIDYKPYIKAREFNSIGTCSNFIDWKTGRQVELLFQTELFAYCILRWNDDVEDINEQFPLDNSIIRKILYEKNQILKEQNMNLIRSPIINQKPMTTDLLVKLNNHVKKAYSVKFDKNKLSDRDFEKLWLEKKYWNNQGIEWKLVDRNDINEVFARNIIFVTEFFDKERVFDKTSQIKHDIATKKLLIDLEKEKLDISKISNLLI